MWDRHWSGICYGQSIQLDQNNASDQGWHRLGGAKASDADGWLRPMPTGGECVFLVKKKKRGWEQVVQK